MERVGSLEKKKEGILKCNKNNFDASVSHSLIYFKKIISKFGFGSPTTNN